MDGGAERARRRRIGLREVRALRPGEMLWDTAVVGFGVRRQRGEAVNYVVFYRTAEGRQRWFTIGRHGSPWTPDTAREEALRLLGEVAAGRDPAADRRAKRSAASLTVADLCGAYLADADAGRLLTRGARRRPPRCTSMAAGSPATSCRCSATCRWRR